MSKKNKTIKNFNHITMKKGIIILTLALTFGGSVSAQQIPLFSQYIFNPYMLNPSMAGQQNEHINLFLAHRSQWTGIPGSPVTSVLAIDGPIVSDKVGFGVNFFNDVTDITKRMGGYASYSYRFDIDNDNSIVPGLSLGVVDNQIDFSKAVVRDNEDPILFSESQRKATFDANFGVSYFFRDLVEAGIAVPQLLGNSFNFTDNESAAAYSLTQHVVFHAKYNYDINDDYSVHPLVALRYAPKTPMQYDINLIAGYRDFVWIGLAYRSNYAAGVNARVTIHDNLSLGMSYDFITTPLKTYAGSNSEIIVSYTFRQKDDKADLVSLEDVSDMHFKLRQNQKVIDDNKAEIERLSNQVDSLMKLKPETTTPVEDSSDKDNSSINNSSSQSDTTANSADSSSTNSSQSENINDSTHDNMEKETEASTLGSEFRMGHQEDFIDELGEHHKGLYLVVGSFGVKENAVNAKTKADEQGYPDTKILYNSVRKIYNVYVGQPEDTEKAVGELDKARGAYPDAWILVLE